MAIFKPTKVLELNVLSSEPLESWPYDEGDPFWTGGPSPTPYRWEYTVRVVSIGHSSPSTLTAYEYNGLDINVGDWVADVNGKVLKIISVTSKTPTGVTMILEDVERYNTLNDRASGGIGGLNGATLVVFEVDSEGMPVLDGLPSSFGSPIIVSNIYGRFQRIKHDDEFMFKKMNHMMTPNDVVTINPDTGEMEKFGIDTNMNPVIGTVSRALPNRFYVRPVNKIVSDISPSLPATSGRYVYADDEGNLTGDKTSKRVYLQLSGATPSTIVGTNAVTTLTVGSVLELNGVHVEVQTQSLGDFVNKINTTSQGIHGVEASETGDATSVTSIADNMIYGIAGALLPMSGTINGVLVDFVTTTSGTITLGSSDMCDAVDMAEDINSAGIPNITASAEGSTLVLYNSAGGEIVLSNAQADGYGTNFAGAGSCTGLPLHTEASTAKRITLSRVDGGEIVVRNVTGSIVDELGVFSVENGKRPIGMIVENWDRKPNLYVVGTIEERDTIDILYKGDEVFVEDTGNGEWSKWLYDGFEWKVIATEDSARTDANTLTITFDHTYSGPLLIGTVSDGSRVSNVVVEVIEPVDDIDSVLNIGDDDDHSRLMSDNIIDMTQLGTYTYTPSHVYETGGDTDLKVFFDPALSTQGQIRVVISYA